MSGSPLGDDGRGLQSAWETRPEEVAELYDRWADVYDDDVERWGYEVPERIAELLAARVSRDREVLDAGCGTGRAGVALRNAGFHEIVGVDFSAASLRAASEHGAYRFLSEADMNQRLPFTDNRFGGAVSAGVFSYLTDTEATVRELLRVIEPGGSLVFTQRTDLWEERDLAGLIEGMVAEGTCTAEIGDPQPYLPGHPEFGDHIEVRYVTLTNPH